MNLVNMNTISKIVYKKGKYLPLEMRMKIYDDVIELRRQRLTCKEIQKIIYEKYGKQISIRTIYFWTNAEHNPLRKINKFDYKPSPELSYVIGAILSDGYKCFDGRGYRLQLAVNDKEFAEAFGEKLAKVLKRNKPYKPFWDEKQKKWIVETYTILLYKFLDKPLEELKPCIEYSKDTVSTFLRSLYDGEGSIYKRMLMLYNTNEELLNYAKYLLLEYFNIDSTGPHLTRKSGKLYIFQIIELEKLKKTIIIFIFVQIVY